MLPWINVQKKGDSEASGALTCTVVVLLSIFFLFYFIFLILTSSVFQPSSAAFFYLVKTHHPLLDTQSLQLRRVWGLKGTSMFLGFCDEFQTVTCHLWAFVEQRLQKRAERFNMPATAESKKALRAAR